MTYEIEPTQCDQEHCIAEFKAHSWGKIKAQKDGWFFTKDGQAWCPKHTPDWVAAWRERRKKESQNHER